VKVVELPVRRVQVAAGHGERTDRHPRGLVAPDLDRRPGMGDVDDPYAGSAVSDKGVRLGGRDAPGRARRRQVPYHVRSRGVAEVEDPQPIVDDGQVEAALAGCHNARPACKWDRADLDRSQRV
jgi:hypothetical protein